MTPREFYGQLCRKLALHMAFKNVNAKLFKCKREALQFFYGKSCMQGPMV